MHNNYGEDFSDTLLILDGTKLKLERQSSLHSQSNCYSDYKSATTLKGFFGMSKGADNSFRPFVCQYGLVLSAGQVPQWSVIK
ncbi:hypothetical protein DPMN_175209 [Dreissena polymorpha]|uniref:Uncharacterized protein n=1 Tax=Dreissena polymorpha TaxID=45954 RepID=A0A9D4IJC6_DREPO|nr:hypothetical protein DPMN_175209 [Dreissena polymorpha]